MRPYRPVAAAVVAAAQNVRIIRVAPSRRNSRQSTLASVSAPLEPP
jgi:hypothetical protein